jgi:purine-binding chemotaxis protein CheW
MFEKDDLDLASLLEDDGEFERARVEMRRLVTFEAGAALYGVAIADVAEVREPLPITPLPIGRTPAQVLGLVSLRGTILPVVDLSKLMGFSATLEFATKPLIITKGLGWQVALLVGMVKGLVRLPVTTFQVTPANMSGAEYCEAITQVDGHLLMQLNIQKLLNSAGSTAEKQKL